MSASEIQNRQKRMNLSLSKKKKALTSVQSGDSDNEANSSKDVVHDFVEIFEMNSNKNA